MYRDTVTTTGSKDEDAPHHVGGSDKAMPSYRSGGSIVTSPPPGRVSTTTSPWGGGDISISEEMSSKSILDFGEVRKQMMTYNCMDRV